MLQIFEEHIKNDNPGIFHGQHCWISTALLTDYNIPVVCTIHGTDLMGYEKAKEILANVNSSKENKEKCKVHCRTHLRKQTKQNSKGGGNCFTAFFFLKKWKCVSEHRRDEHRDKKQRMHI
mgnify:CR=1 FL=1